MRVALIGYGAIGSRVGRALAAGKVPGARLVGVHTRSPERAEGVDALGWEGTLAGADLVVECAGTYAARDLGPGVVAAGRTLLLTSIGALAHPPTRRALLETGPGRTVLTSGAVGGLDLLSAAALGGGLEEASLETAKLPATLIQPWMDRGRAAEIRATGGPVRIFDGSVVEAIDRFPQSLNVAVALAHATNLWEETRVRLVADPAAACTRHLIRARGRAGSYQFSIENAPMDANPATSAVVADAVLKAIAALGGASGVVV